jgi:hypothetical protein
MALTTLHITLSILDNAYVLIILEKLGWIYPPIVRLPIYKFLELKINVLLNDLVLILDFLLSSCCKFKLHM